MFSNWFSEKQGSSTAKNDGGDSSAPITSPVLTSPAPVPASQSPESPVPHNASTPYGSPHDAIIARIDNNLQELQTAATSNDSTDPERIAQAGEPVPPKLRSRDLPENIYDPFDGQSIGLMVPGEFKEEEDDLWTHLAQIRDLQSDIARMHAQMERLGDIDRPGIADTAEDEAVDGEDETKAAKAAEFAKLTDQFTGRKEAIDAVMAKLETLSHSINEFHSSRAPLFRPAASQLTCGGKTPMEITGASSAERPLLHNGFFSPSQDNVFKDSPESISRSLEDHPQL